MKNEKIRLAIMECNWDIEHGVPFAQWLHNFTKLIETVIEEIERIEEKIEKHHELV